MLRILVIDDDAPLRRAVRVLLEEHGYEVDDAQDGNEGLRMFRQKPSDIIICDVYMPGKDGLETIREIRRLSNTVTLIAISGGSHAIGADLLAIAKHMGANVTLYKPFKLAELLEVIRAQPAPSSSQQ